MGDPVCHVKLKTLCKNPWVSLFEMSWPEKGIAGYVFSRETRCHGHIIVVLPYRFVKGGYELMFRREVTPCWHPTEQKISSITGGWEADLSFEETAINEIKEEAGYIVEERELINLGECFGMKSTDTVYHLFSVDLTNRERIEATGDGSELEAKAECYWTPPADICQIDDPLLAMAFVRLQDKQRYWLCGR